MKKHFLGFQLRRSRSSTRKMIFTMARYSDHGKAVQFRSDADIKRYFSSRGVDFNQLIDRLRDPSQRVPIFENILSSTWQVEAGDGSVSRVDRMGTEDLTITGPGILALHGYWAGFETAFDSFHMAVQQSSYTKFQSAVVQGIASIEGYITYRAETWNKGHPEDVLIDSRQNKVSFNDKIDQWLPKMANGKQLHKGDEKWNHFRKLRDIRDNLNIHPKVSGYSIKLSKFADQMNLFRTGIAQILIELHKLFEESVPSIIIRAAYAPTVEVVSEEISG